MLDTMNTKLMNPPQNDLRLVGLVELPPIICVPCNNHGYIVILAQ